MAFASSVVTAPSAQALLADLRASAHARRDGDPSFPHLTDGELLQPAEFFRAHDVAGWDSLARLALGFRREGDKFRAGTLFDDAHYASDVPLAELARVWGRASGLATALDARERSPQSFAPPPLTRAFVDRIASPTFRLLERERAAARPRAAAIPKLPPPFDKIPKVIKPIRPGKSLKRSGLLLLALAAVVLLSKGK